MITRGNLSSLGPGSYGSCLAPAVVGLTYDDTEMPAAGAGYLYLIQPASSCGLGTLGYDSSGSERINLDAAACP